MHFPSFPGPKRFLFDLHREYFSARLRYALNSLDRWFFNLVVKATCRMRDCASSSQGDSKKRDLALAKRLFSLVSQWQKRFNVLCGQGSILCMHAMNAHHCWNNQALFEGKPLMSIIIFQMNACAFIYMFRSTQHMHFLKQPLLKRLGWFIITFDIFSICFLPPILLSVPP